MAKSRMCGPLNHVWSWPAARTPGPLGLNDQSDPNLCSMLGDSPGPLGLADWADPCLPALAAWWPGLSGGMYRLGDGLPVAVVQTDPHAGALTPSTQSTDLSWEQIKTDMLLHEALVRHLYLDTRVRHQHA